MEQHHPIMDKLGDHGGRTYRQHEKYNTEITHAEKYKTEKYNRKITHAEKYDTEI